MRGPTPRHEGGVAAAGGGIFAHNPPRASDYLSRMREIAAYRASQMPEPGIQQKNPEMALDYRRIYIVTYIAA